MDKIILAKEKEQTDLFASNAAHTEKVKGVSPEQIRVLNNYADASEWEKQIDTLVYALYNLTEDEIKIVEEQK